MIHFELLRDRGILIVTPKTRSRRRTSSWSRKK